jgi:hypothetical protein
MGPEETMGGDEWLPEHEKQQQNNTENSEVAAAIRGKTGCMINSTITRHEGQAPDLKSQKATNFLTKHVPLLPHSTSE